MSKQKYRPLGNRVVIKPVKEIEAAKREVEEGKIILADSAIIFSHGEVVSVGRGEIAPQTGTLIPMELNPGDKVIFRKECPYLPLIIDGEECRLMREPDVDAVI